MAYGLRGFQSASIRGVDTETLDLIGTKMSEKKISASAAATATRVAAKSALSVESMALVAALDPSKENREVVKKVLGTLFTGALRRDPENAVLIARAAFGMSGSTGERYLSAFQYRAKDGTTAPFDGTPRAVVALAGNLESLRDVILKGASHELQRAQKAGYADKIKAAEKKYDAAMKTANADAVIRLQAKVNATLAIMADTIAQCEEWAKKGEAIPA